jgi:hypothetical protein
MYVYTSLNADDSESELLRKHVRLPRHACQRRACDRYPHLYTSAYVSIRQHTSAYVSIRRDTPASGAPVTAIRTCIRQHTSAYVSIRRDTPASGAPVIAIRTCIRQHTSAYVSMRQDTSGYVSIRFRL